MAEAREDPSWLTDQEWTWVSDHLPVACVDVLPVQRDRQGVVVRVGLIRRVLQGQDVWCQLGGRLLYGESTREGAQRHLRTTLQLKAGGMGELVPFFVNEYFRERAEGLGYDPRKHAVAVCYLVDLLGSPSVVDGGEAIEFRWFDLGRTPPEGDLWPGTGAMLAKISGTTQRDGAELTYETISARHISHNELMWQTPLLAMTAMAFLMTIALGNGEPWARATAALLSTVTAVVSVQLMAKHSHSERRDADRLWALEAELGLHEVHSAPNGHPSWIGRGLGWMEERLAKWKSRHWWLIAMLLFGIVSFIVCVVAVRDI